MLKLCFVGLGNPGSKYNNTRHNIGKDWLLKLCESESVKLLNKTKFEADLAYSESEEILYVVPNNYVNNSGRTISKLVKNLNLSESKIIILAKDNSGNATSYKTNIIIQLSLTKDEKIMKNKRFEKNFTYSNLNNKFELSKYQKQVESNMINSLAQEIRIFLDF